MHLSHNFYVIYFSFAANLNDDERGFDHKGAKPKHSKFSEIVSIHSKSVDLLWLYVPFLWHSLKKEEGGSMGPMLEIHILKLNMIKK